MLKATVPWCNILGPPWLKHQPCYLLCVAGLWVWGGLGGLPYNVLLKSLKRRVHQFPGLSPVSTTLFTGFGNKADISLVSLSPPEERYTQKGQTSGTEAPDLLGNCSQKGIHEVLGVKLRCENIKAEYSMKDKQRNPIFSNKRAKL